MLVWVKIRVIDMLAMYDSWNVDSRSIFHGLQGIEKSKETKEEPFGTYTSTVRV